MIPVSFGLTEHHRGESLNKGLSISTTAAEEAATHTIDTPPSESPKSPGPAFDDSSSAFIRGGGDGGAHTRELISHEHDDEEEVDDGEEVDEFDSRGLASGDRGYSNDDDQDHTRDISEIDLELQVLRNVQRRINEQEKKISRTIAGHNTDNPHKGDKGEEGGEGNTNILPSSSSLSSSSSSSSISHSLVLSNLTNSSAHRNSSGDGVPLTGSGHIHTPALPQPLDQCPYLFTQTKMRILSVCLVFISLILASVSAARVWSKVDFTVTPNMPLSVSNLTSWTELYSLQTYSSNSDGGDFSQHSYSDGLYNGRLSYGTYSTHALVAVGITCICLSLIGVFVRGLYLVFWRQGFFVSLIVFCAFAFEFSASGYWLYYVHASIRDGSENLSQRYSTATITVTSAPSLQQGYYLCLASFLFLILAYGLQAFCWPPSTNNSRNYVHIGTGIRR